MVSIKKSVSSFWKRYILYRLLPPSRNRPIITYFCFSFSEQKPNTHAHNASVDLTLTAAYHASPTYLLQCLDGSNDWSGSGQWWTFSVPFRPVQDTWGYLPGSLTEWMTKKYCSWRRPLVNERCMWFFFCQSLWYWNVCLCSRGGPFQWRYWGDDWSEARQILEVVLEICQPLLSPGMYLSYCFRPPLNLLF